MQYVAANGVLTRVEFGDERDFADLIVPLVDRGYRLACAMLHDPEAAKDVVQDACVIAWRKIPRLEDRRLASSWFLGIVGNECRNARRRHWVARVLVGVPAGISVDSQEDRIVRAADLRQALMRLGHRDQLIVSLYFYLDLPMDEIARIAGCSAGAARVRLHRAVRKLRPDLSIEEALR